MNRVVTRMHRGQSGFTLIELLVVIAILGVIAAIVALNVAGFFGRGTLQAAKTEAHQAQTAIISAMADGQINRLVDPSNNQTLAVDQLWSGEAGVIVVLGTDGKHYDASTYIYGPFRATYKIDRTGAIVDGCADPSGDLCAFGCEASDPWGSTIIWGGDGGWQEAP